MWSIQEIGSGVGDRVYYETYLFSKHFIDLFHFNIIIVFNAIVKNSCNKEIDIIEILGAEQSDTKGVDKIRLTGIFSFLPLVCVDGKVTGSSDNIKMAHEVGILR